MGTNFSKIRGDDVVISLTFKDSSGVVIDITNYTIFFTLKTNKYDLEADAVLTKTVTVHSDPTHGYTLISLTGAETALLEGSYYYDIAYKTGAGVHKTVANGAFSFKDDITTRTT
jgi:hypothetical protein